MAEDDAERTEAPSAKRREEARKKGQVVGSREITSAMLLLGGVWGLSKMGPPLVLKTRAFMIHTWSSFSSSTLTEEKAYELLMFSLQQSLMILIPIMLFLTAISVVSTGTQHKWLWTFQPLAPNWSRLNPMTGFGRLFSLRAIVELVKTLVKFIAVGYVTYLALRKEVPEILVAIQTAPVQMLGTVGGMVFRLTLWTGLAIAILSVGDYLYNWWEHEKGLKMSRKELKDETRQSEGDPMVKSRIRSVQREMARKRMMAEVPKAEVVITNPTALAIALMYKPGTMEAPKVVAKGAGFIAQRIRELAKEHDVPIIENKPLARELFKLVKIGEYIPSKFYRAVAEILAYVLKLRGKYP